MENSTNTLQNLVHSARKWMDMDPDPFTRDLIGRMLERPELSQLQEYFAGHLSFGTAGIRGEIGPGPNRMNRLLVCRVSSGLGAYIHGLGIQDATVVIGFDGRHGSKVFACDTATVLASMGVTCWLYESVVPTPELAHAVTFLGASAGVMVTASHNPPKDNGFKVYWSNGAQIIPPHDRGISDAMDDVAFDPRLLDQYSNYVETDVILSVPDEVGEKYVQRVLGLRCGSSGPLRIVYTPMHGVGRKRVEEVLRRAGYDDVWTVPEQAEPDPDFSTVAFPNPEEPHALDLAMALASKKNADLIIANDPDADRLAICVPVEGGWRQFTGNEVGIILAEDLLSKCATTNEQLLVATTIVSTPLLAQIAGHYGVSHVETLTGFKWIANKAIEFEETGGRFVIGFEEALGYCIGSVVRDKDGISAALLLCDVLSECHARGETLLDRLSQIYRRHGVYASGQVAIEMSGADGAQKMQDLMSRWRAAPPEGLLGHRLIKVRDALLGETLDRTSGQIDEWAIPSSNVLGWTFSDGTTFLARPSGTEPKIKFYAYVRESYGPMDDLSDAESRARKGVQRWLEAMVQEMSSVSRPPYRPI